MKEQKFELLSKLKRLHHDSQFAKAAANVHFDHGFTKSDIGHARYMLKEVEERIGALETVIAVTP